MSTIAKGLSAIGLEQIKSDEYLFTLLEFNYLFAGGKNCLHGNVVCTGWEMMDRVYPNYIKKPSKDILTTKRRRFTLFISKSTGHGKLANQI